jgi:hypothetical protein
MADDELPENVTLAWIGQNLLALRAEMRDGFARLDVGIVRLEQHRADDRALLEDITKAALAGKAR